MNQSVLSTSDLVQQRHKSVEEGPSGGMILKEAIVKVASGHHEWPPPGQERVSLVYAIYMEPDLQGGFQPFRALWPRLYFIFDLGWPIPVGGWFDYQITERTDGSCVGDPDFPSCIGSKCAVAGFSSAGSPFPSHVPGELLVGFGQDIDEKTAREVVARELPNSEVIGSLWMLQLLHITCTPFDEPKQAAIIEAAGEVRYAEVNYHQHLGVPGGHWKTRRVF
jgi:hypothetical protein